MLIPDNINDFVSQGERLLYFKFKNEKTAQNFYVLHSVFTNYHLNNISGELDFLVLAPGMGVFAIEVKHGGVSREKGTWVFENGAGGVTKKKKSPFSQVHGTMHSIRQYILEEVSHDQNKYERVKGLLFGTGVAFTSMNNNIDFGPEAYSWQILTKAGLRLPIFKYIKTISEGWHNEYRSKNWYNENKSRPTRNDCEFIYQVIRGDFNINYSEINRISDNEKIIEEFTKEQFQVLNIVNFNDRCLIEGQAGTGKTVLALELARRRLKWNENVGFFCFNNQLGRKLSRTVSSTLGNGKNNYYVGTLHSYMMNKTNVQVPKIDKSQFYTEILPIEFIIQNEINHSENQFDFLILDEAQDLLTNYYLEIFDCILKGGLSKGKWVIFGDFSNQAIYLNNPFNTLEDLNARVFYTKLPPLKINCRNTKKIANHNTLLTGIDLPDFTKYVINGKSIEVKFPSPNKQRQEIEGIIKSLINNEIPLSKISLLSPKQVNDTCFDESDFLINLKKEGLIVSTIQSYKGLENAIIVLYGFNEITSETSKKLLYVGISRATQRLYIVLNVDLKADYQRIVKDNIPKLNTYEY